jgi:hypothetical protein
MCKILCHEGHELDSGDLQDLLQIDAEVGDRVAGAGDPAGIGWRLYERLAAAIEAEGAGIDGSVTLNARVRGSVSGRWRQVDMLMDTRWEDGAGRRVIFDAKMRRQPVDINDVESFEGMMRDCSAKHGVIICSSGWTAGAERRAQDAITIKLLTIEEADKWSPHFTPCGEEFAVPDGGLFTCGCGRKWASATAAAGENVDVDDAAYLLLLLEGVPPIQLDRRPLS